MEIQKYGNAGVRKYGHLRIYGNVRKSQYGTTEISEYEDTGM